MFDGYLASPYSITPDNPIVRETRFLQAAGAVAYGLRRNVYLYSPIVHSHPVAVMGQLGHAAADWKFYNAVAMSTCHMLWILMLQGWEVSEGIYEEVKFFINRSNVEAYCVMVSYLNNHYEIMSSRQTLISIQEHMDERRNGNVDSKLLYM